MITEEYYWDKMTDTERQKSTHVLKSEEEMARNENMLCYADYCCKKVIKVSLITFAKKYVISIV